MQQLFGRFSPTEIQEHFHAVVLPRIYTRYGRLEDKRGSIDTPCPYYKSAQTPHTHKTQLFFILHWLTQDDEYARLMIPIDIKRESFVRVLVIAFHHYTTQMDWHLPDIIDILPMGIRAIPGTKMNMDIVIRVAAACFALR